MRKAFERFCYKHERRGISNLMHYIAGGYLISFVIWLFEPRVFGMMMFNLDAVLEGEIWRVVTFLIVPPIGQDMVRSVFYAVVVIVGTVYMGRVLEREWGRMKLTIYYFAGALIILTTATVVTLTAGPIMRNFIWADGWYLSLSVILAVATVDPEAEVYFNLFLPVKGKLFLIVGAIPFILAAFRVPWPLVLIPMAALVNYLLFFGGDLVRIARRKPKQTYRSAQFKSKVRKADKTKGKRAARHTCAECGITNIDDPGMEFRYCSLCSDYSCYCSRHLFGHRHK